VSPSLTDHQVDAPPRVEMVDIRKRYGVLDVLRGVNLRVLSGSGQQVS
jgi:ABC-type histidine transport system ATPase subunit